MATLPDFPTIPYIDKLLPYLTKLNTSNKVDNNNLETNLSVNNTSLIDYLIDHQNDRTFEEFPIAKLDLTFYRYLYYSKKSD